MNTEFNGNPRRMQEKELETFRPITDELHGKTCATQHEMPRRWTDYTGHMSMEHECTQQQIGSLEQENRNSNSFLAPLRRLPPELLAEIFVIVIECCEQDPFAVMHVWQYWYQKLDRIEHTALGAARRLGEALQSLGILYSRADLNRNTGFRGICFKCSLVMAVFTSQ